jgi:hypothetical protein
MDTMICACDFSYTCEAHVAENDAMTWPAVLGLKPTPQDAWDAYEGGYKGRYFEGWDVA